MRPKAIAAAVVTVLACLLAPASAPASASWRWPVSGPVLTPYSNGTDPYASGQHRGVDIAAPVGAPVAAAAAGVVTFAGSVGSAGLTVAVRTDDGFDTSYLHLSSVAVRAGDRVASGAPIGRVGTTGRRSAAAPHLHFGVREAGTRFAYRDPLDLLPVPPPATAPPAPAPVPVPVTVPPPPRPALVPPPVALRPSPVPLDVGPRARPFAGASEPALAPLSTLPSHASPPSRAALLPAAGVTGRPSPARPAAGAHRGGAATGDAASGAAAATAPSPVLDGRSRHPSPSHPAVRRSGRRGEAPAPRPSPGPSRVRASRLTGPTLTPSSRRTLPHDGPGIDLGWLAACVAMVAAAAILGRPRATTRSLRHALGVPLAGPRSEPDRP
jgi:hypothetical protein